MLLVYDPKQLQAEPVSGTQDCVADCGTLLGFSLLCSLLLSTWSVRVTVSGNSKNGVGMRWGG